MARLQQIRTKANTVLTDFWSKLQTKQTTYFNNHGKFFHLVITNEIVDGEDTTFSVNVCADEQFNPDFTYNSPVPFQIQVDEGGNEYSVTAVIELTNGDKYTRSRRAIANIENNQVVDYQEEDTNWQSWQ